MSESNACCGLFSSTRNRRFYQCESAKFRIELSENSIVRDGEKCFNCDRVIKSIPDVCVDCGTFPCHCDEFDLVIVCTEIDGGYECLYVNGEKTIHDLTVTGKDIVDSAQSDLIDLRHVNVRLEESEWPQKFDQLKASVITDGRTE